MRSRNIKPGFFKNEDLVELDPIVRLLFVGLWCLADRRGVLEDRPRRIKMEIFPGDNTDVVLGLDQLEAAGLIQRYRDGQGVKLLVVLNFEKHQHPHHQEKPSGLAGPDAEGSTSEINRTTSEINGTTSEINRTNTEPTPNQPQANLSDSLLLIPDSLLLIPDSLSLDPLLPGVRENSRLDLVETQVTQVLEHFKKTTGKNRVSVKAESNRKFVRARLQTDNIPLADLMAIITLKTQQAERGDFPGQYLRIETLFNATKCQSYLSELDGVQERPQESSITKNNRLALQGFANKVDIQ